MFELVAFRRFKLPEERTFQIQLEGLIQLLAQNLYAEPDVFLREMIQNAHDSITRRVELQRENNGQQAPPGRIQIVTDPAARQIQIHDNGAGLTDKEIDEYLSTIGRSGTAELRQRLKAADHARTVELIGQFGIGLLSAFIVASQVTVVTKATGHEALRWESHGDRNYTVEAAERSETGTTVTLHLKSHYNRYLEAGRLETIIRTYADFIGIPVYLNDGAEPVNAVVAPWHRTNYRSEEERADAYRNFFYHKFTAETPLHTFAVDESFTWTDASLPGGEATGRVRGVLGITDRRTPGVNVRGTVDVYINRMFIGGANRDILPPWASFLQGVIECNDLTPNAARDNVIRNAALARLQEILGSRIVRELIDLSQREHQRFVEIMGWHAYPVLAMSVQAEHEEFFRAVADLMPLESDRGPTTVADYLRTASSRSDGSRLVHYITDQGSANQYRLLASARDIHVFFCTEPFAEQFLERYARTWPDRIHLSRLDAAGLDRIFEPLAADETARFDDLRNAYRTLVFPEGGHTVKVSRFRPVELPAVLTETRDNTSRRDMANLAADLRIPDALRDLVKDFLDQEHEPLTLHLNADNPAIQKLAARQDLRDEVSRQALVSLYNNALLLLARALPVESVQTMFTQYNQVIERMLSLAEEQARLSRTLNAKQTELDEFRTEEVADADVTAWGSCFVALPFSDQRADDIYAAVREVLEDGPYFWQVMRADDDVEAPGLWPNVKKKLLRAHCYVAVLTGELNPNVMIEVGRMEALQRPLIMLKDSGAADPPADLQGLLYEPVRAAGREQLRAELAEILERQKPLLSSIRPRDRYLSETVLARHASLGEQASRQISRLYPSWNGFLTTDSAVIARQAGVRVPLVDAVKQALTEIPDATAS